MVQPKDFRLALWLLEEYADWITNYAALFLGVGK